MSRDQIHLCAGLTLDLARGCLLRAGEEVHLRPQSYEVLKYLAENRGRLVSKDRLIEEVWEGRAVTDNSLSKCIEEVRGALGADARQHLRNVRGRGYIFDSGDGGWSERGELVKSEQIEIVKVVVEEEEAEGGSEAAARAVLPPAQTAGRLVPAPGRGRALAFWAACLLAVCLAAGAAYYFLRPDSGKFSNVAGVRTLAVLPFKPLVPGGRDEALEVGMADTLIAKLSNIGGVTVRPLGSVRRYGGLEQDPLDAGRRLGVEAVLDGTVQRSGDSVRVTARLVRVGDGRQLWEGRFDAPFTDIFSAQDAISAEVAGALHPKLTGAEERQLAKRPTQNVEAYQLYLKGRYHYFKTTEPEIRKAIGFYRQAIDADPTYALAYAGLADAYRILPIVGFVPSTEGFPQAKAAARRALEIDENLAEAHIVLGWIGFSFDWDWPAAERELKRAIELSPNNADARRAYAHLLSNLGRHDEAVAEAARARELDPLSLITGALEGQFLFYAGRDDEAISRLRKTLEMEPNYWVPHVGLGRVYTRQGRYDEAVAAFNKARELSSGNAEVVTQLGYALAKAGRREQARATLEELKSLSASSYVPAYNFAMIHNGLGEGEEALKYLGQSLRGREVQVTFIKVDARWDDLRADPRFQDLLRHVGLTP